MTTFYRKQFRQVEFVQNWSLLQDSNSALDVNHNPASGVLTTKMPQFYITTTGDYIFVIRIHRMDGQLYKPFTAIVEVEMKGDIAHPGLLNCNQTLHASFLNLR